ncbi:transposase family protein [Leptotrichia sp. HSP-342]|uniref:Transposase family protein n=1 Tax=Leptotrichia mesophila TaxID=3239303 RepID=A0AB39V9P2_9FUSO
MINNVGKIKKLKEENYQKIFGIKKNTFDKMLKLLNESYRIEHLRGGHPPKLSVLDRLVIMLSYYHDYKTMENIALEYGVAKSTICECVKWVENILIKSEEFSLPKKRELVRDTEIEAVMVDATECEIERPKKNSENITREKRKSTR